MLAQMNKIQSNKKMPLELDQALRLEMRFPAWTTGRVPFPSGPGSCLVEPRGLQLPYKEILSLYLPDHCASWWSFFFSTWLGQPWGIRHLVKRHSEWICQYISWWYWHLNGKLDRANTPLPGGWVSCKRLKTEENKTLNPSRVRENLGGHLPKMELWIFLSFKPSWSVGSPWGLSLPFLDWSLSTSPPESPAFWLQNWGLSALYNHVIQLFTVNLFQYLLLTSSPRKPRLM